MIATGIKKTPVKNAPKSFPKLMKNKMYVILFTNMSTGTVVHKLALGGAFTVGYHTAEWNEVGFKDTDETVTLCSAEQG